MLTKYEENEEITQKIALDFIKQNKLFERERGYLRSIIKDCLDE